MDRVLPALCARRWCASFAVLATVLVCVLAPAAAVALPPQPPALTGLASSTHPTDTVWYSSRTADFSWNVDSSFTGYSFALDRNPSAPTLDDLRDGLKPAYAAGAAGYLEPSKQWAPEDVETADFNGDGKQDTVWSCGYRAFVQLGNGDGTFTAVPGFLQPEYLSDIIDIKVADFNGDARLDLAFALHSPTMGLAVSLGNGDGTFQAPVPYPATGWMTGRAMTPADFNADGKLDLAVVYDQIDSGISVYEGVGDGSFSAPTTYTIPGAYPANWVMDIASGDLNGDGWPEIVAAGTHADKAIVYTNDGTGEFGAAPVEVAVGQYPLKVLTADFNADGRCDIVTGNGAGTAEPATVLLNKGDGTYERRAIPSTNNAQFGNLRVADMNHDGTPDIVGFNRYSYTGMSTIDVLMNDGAGWFPTVTVTQGYGNARRVLALGDFDSNAIPDVAVCSQTADENAIIPLLASPGAEITAPDDGVWYFHVRGVEAGQGGPVSDMKVLIDTTAPGVDLTGAVDGAAYSPKALPSPSIVASDPNMPDASGLAGIRWTSSTGDSGFEAGPSVPISVPTTPGVYTWSAYAVDSAGNAGVPRVFFITVLGDVAGLVSPTHPDPGHWYPGTKATFVWEQGTGPGYSYSLDRDPKGTPDFVADEYGTPLEARYAEESLCTTTLAGLKPGTWYFHVREVGSGAGARVSTIRINIRAAGVATIGTVRFAGNSAALTAASKANLRKYAAYIESRTYRTVYVDGYSAHSVGGSAAYRKRLSYARATAVRRYLNSCLRQLEHPVTFVVTGRGAVPGSPPMRAADRKVVVRAK